MTETYAGWLARTLPELGFRELNGLAAENGWHEDGGPIADRLARLGIDSARTAEQFASLYLGAVTEERRSAVRAIRDRAEDAQWAAEDKALAAHYAAQAGTRSHGGHGWDGETCSGIPVQS